MKRPKFGQIKVLAVGAATGLALLFWPAISAAQSITEFAVNGNPAGIVAGPDNALWFTEFSGNKIGRMTTAGALVEFSIPTSNSLPYGITLGPDGALWFTEQQGNKIGRITTAGVITEFTIPTSSSAPYGITAGPDGALWFAEGNGNNIGQITIGGVITEFAIPTANSLPDGITVGPDGALWFIENGTSPAIGQITTAGVFAEYPFPTATTTGQASSSSNGSVAPLWFTEHTNNKIGSITTAGGFTEFSVPTSNSYPYGIAVGPDGALWFTEKQGNKVGQVTTSGDFTEFTIPTPNSQPLFMAPGPDGALWFTESNVNKIGRIAIGNNNLQVSPTTNIAASGNQGGPFSPSSFQYQLSTSSGSVGYSISGLPSWLTASSTSGTATTSPTTVTFSVNSSANSLCGGTYDATINFADTTDGTLALTISATLTVTGPNTLVVTPSTNIASSGNHGGPFSPSSFQYQLSATSCAVNYSISGVPSWLDVSSSSGTVATTPATVTFTVNSSAGSLAANTYNATISFTNTSNGQGNQTRSAALTVNSQPSPPTANQTWVSGTGDDNNDCSSTAPCLTFAGAIAKTAAGGEINCLDSGGYGGATITQSITIICKKVKAGVLVSGTNGFVINAGTTDVIELNGLAIDGSGTGTAGVYLVSGGTLRIVNSLIRGFQSSSPAGNGIVIAPSAGNVQFTMDEVTVSENGGSSGGTAVVIQPTGGATVNATLTNVSITNNNGAGISLDGTGGPISVAMHNSVVSNGSGIGLSAIGANTVNVLSDRSAFTGNVTGIAVSGTGASVRLTRSQVKANATGLVIASGSIASYGDNQIAGNTSDGPAPSSVSHK